MDCIDGATAAPLSNPEAAGLTTTPSSPCQQRRGAAPAASDLSPPSPLCPDPTQGSPCKTSGAPLEAKHEILGGIETPQITPSNGALSFWGRWGMGLQRGHLSHGMPLPPTKGSVGNSGPSFLLLRRILDRPQPGLFPRCLQGLLQLHGGGRDLRLPQLGVSRGEEEALGGEGRAGPMETDIPISAIWGWAVYENEDGS